MNPQASSNAIIVFVLGILSLVVCAALGPVAWAMGKTELRKIAAGESSQAGHAWANAGMICGIIGTALLALTALFMVAWFAMFASAMH
jgi:hypothetical protein